MLFPKSRLGTSFGFICYLKQKQRLERGQEQKQRKGVAAEVRVMTEMGGREGMARKVNKCDLTEKKMLQKNILEYDQLKLDNRNMHDTFLLF